MRFVVHRFQAIRRNMRIYLRRRKIRVPEQFLHAAQVRTAVEHVRRERVAQAMRRYMLRDAAEAYILIEYTPYTSVPETRTILT